MIDHDQMFTHVLTLPCPCMHAELVIGLAVLTVVSLLVVIALCVVGVVVIKRRNGHRRLQGNELELSYAVIKPQCHCITV